MGSIRYKVTQVNDTEVIEEIHKVIVHKFSVSDTDDPEIYAAEPILRWQNSEEGQFVLKNAISIPEYHQHLNHTSFNYEFSITAELEKKKLSEFYLRWGKK